MSDPAFHQQNRARLAERLGARRAAGLFFTAAHKVRNHDSEYRFRPESDFWWLTGFGEPESALVVLPPLEGTGAAKLASSSCATRTASARSGPAGAWASPRRPRR